MPGLAAILNNRYSVRSDRGSGDGRFDMQLFPLRRALPGILIELKASKDIRDILRTPLLFEKRS
jgi:hypothetical protein